MSTHKPHDVEEKLDQLLQICMRLASENETLQQEKSNLVVERTALIEKIALAQSRIEAMILRLKSMETST